MINLKIWARGSAISDMVSFMILEEILSMPVLVFDLSKCVVLITSVGSVGFMKNVLLLKFEYHMPLYSLFFTSSNLFLHIYCIHVH